MVKSTAFEYWVLLIKKYYIQKFIWQTEFDKCYCIIAFHLNFTKILLVKFKWKAFPFPVAGQEGSFKVCKQPIAVIFLQ